MQVQLTPEETREQGSAHVAPTLDELVREGARRMLALALEVEVAEYIGQHQHLRGENGLQQVVRNERAAPRKVVIGGMAVPVAAPRVEDRREGEKFTSAVLPPYRRRSQRLAAACRSFTCGGSPPETSLPPWKSCWGRQRAASLPPTSCALRRCGKRSIAPAKSGT